MAQFAASTDSFQDFTYGAPANDAGAMALSVSVYADRGWLRDEIAEDAAAAGFRIAVREGLAELLEGASRPLGDVVLVDCPLVDAGVMAALSRLDVRAGHAGAQLVVSTSVEALDDVFACLDQSGAQILVAPSRAERVIALGGVLARMPSRRVRELSDEDRVMLLRLTQQVSQIAERIDRWLAIRCRPRSLTSWYATPNPRCPIRVWCAGSSVNARCAPAFSMAICSLTLRGICCLI